MLVSLLLPVAWVVLLLVLGGYDMRFLGTGSDEFRKVLNAGWSLTAGVARFLTASTPSCPAYTW